MTSHGMTFLRHNHNLPRAKIQLNLVAKRTYECQTHRFDVSQPTDGCLFAFTLVSGLRQSRLQNNLDFLIPNEDWDCSGDQRLTTSHIFLIADVSNFIISTSWMYQVLLVFLLFVLWRIFLLSSHFWRATKLPIACRHSVLIISCLLATTTV